MASDPNTSKIMKYNTRTRSKELNISKIKADNPHHTSLALHSLRAIDDIPGSSESPDWTSEELDFSGDTREDEPLQPSAQAGRGETGKGRGRTSTLPTPATPSHIPRKSSDNFVKTATSTPDAQTKGATVGQRYFPRDIPLAPTAPAPNMTLTATVDLVGLDQRRTQLGFRDGAAPLLGLFSSYVPILTDSQVDFLYKQLSYECQGLAKEEINGIKASIGLKNRSFDYWLGWLEGYSKGTHQQQKKTLEKALKETLMINAQCKEQFHDANALVGALSEIYKESRSDIELLNKNTVSLTTTCKELLTRAGVPSSILVPPRATSRPTSTPSLPSTSSGKSDLEPPVAKIQRKTYAIPVSNNQEYQLMVDLVAEVSKANPLHLQKIGMQLKPSKEYWTSLAAVHGRIATRAIIGYAQQMSVSVSAAAEKIDNWMKVYPDFFK